MTDLDAVEKAARELVDRHGNAARGIALARVEPAEKEGGPQHSTALLVLSAVERLRGRSPPKAIPPFFPHPAKKKGLGCPKPLIVSAGAGPD